MDGGDGIIFAPSIIQWQPPQVGLSRCRDDGGGLWCGVSGMIIIDTTGATRSWNIGRRRADIWMNVIDKWEPGRNGRSKEKQRPRATFFEQRSTRNTKVLPRIRCSSGVPVPPDRTLTPAEVDQTMVDDGIGFRWVAAANQRHANPRSVQFHYYV